ncbi:hypothetical protein [Stenotrophomonas maltophilia]|uniref:hypothetical protein n=1 Tax=Stenotrophomonas maltophilia TaxID=40324 RepID=UPI0012B15C78|nr:hypothetical protein [Stenotrophomonas maltophilia]QGM05635.1 hypothetical protein FEO88_12380 [Stenotrophomonas maltophilia]
MAVATAMERDSTRWRTCHVLALPMLYAGAVVGLYVGTEQQWIRMPWDVVATIALTLAIVLGFRLHRAHARSTEARRHVESILVASRSWLLLARNTSHPMDPGDALGQRHLAWLAALRYERRKRDCMGGRTLPALPEGPGRLFLQREWRRLEQKLAAYVGPRERERILASSLPSREVLTLQCESLGALLGQDAISPSAFLQLHRLLHELQRLQVEEERVRPRMHPAVSRAEAPLLLALILLMPFGLIDAMGPLVLFDDHPIRAIACWAIVPISTGVVWLYVALAAATKGELELVGQGPAGKSGDSSLVRIEQELADGDRHA